MMQIVPFVHEIPHHSNQSLKVGIKRLLVNNLEVNEKRLIKDMRKRGDGKRQKMTQPVQNSVVCGNFRCCFAAAVVSLPCGVRFKKPIWIR